MMSENLHEFRFDCGLLLSRPNKTDIPGGDTLGLVFPIPLTSRVFAVNISGYPFVDLLQLKTSKPEQSSK